MTADARKALALVWFAALLFSILAFCCNCALACLCPRKLRRCVCVVALLLLATSVVFTAYATHRIRQLEAEFIRDSEIIAAFAL